MKSDKGQPTGELAGPNVLWQVSNVTVGETVVHIANIPILVNLGVMTAVSVIALWRGGPQERLIAVLQQLMVVNGAFHLYPPAQGFVTDVVELAACLACVVHGRSYWTIWASGALLLSLATDLVFMAMPGIGRWAYASAELVWCYAATIALLCGALARRPAEAVAARRQAIPWLLRPIAPASR